MKKVITQLAVGITMLTGMLVATTDVVAQQPFLTSGVQLRNATQLRAAKTPTPLKTSEYVAKDINGNDHDIDAILKSGKSIMIDISAVWCGPCWTLHQSGALERLYKKFGPEGSNQIEVFWVGGDSRSTVEKIHGKGSGTQGDWTKDSKGNPVPYPLFADPQMYPALGIPVEGFPTLVLVGPGNKWVECRGEVQTNDPDFKEFKKLLSLFMTEKDKPAALRFTGVTDLYQGETHIMKLAYNTVAPITSVKWEAPAGIKLTKVNDTEYKVTAETLGSYEISATVTNKNGDTKESIKVTVSAPISTFPLSCPMDTKDKLDKGWRSVDLDGDGLGFDSFMGKGFMGRLGLSYKDPNTKAGAENSEDCLISFGKFYPTALGQGGFSGNDINAKNELLSAPLVIPADAKAPTFSCFITTLFTADNPDKLKVMVTEPNGTPVELLAPQSAKGSDWTLISADLSAYKGKTILLSLVPVVNGVSAIQVDQLRVTMDGSTAVDTPTLNVETILYPNPATEFITVQTRAGSTIELFTLDGARVAETKAINGTTTLAVGQLPAGTYMARITDKDGNSVSRPVVVQ
ncbi:T9SS type A sorting domain-containing protein [Porphyromonas endodontalis]|uniref:T9SS type A sorting domain-containing protein n=1 Tax=Porphyromonas endodontalis TaxID=28124 RepID=UPI0026F37299|nr:T9SS type A sorting domain-containing protein [Porphyromonas endodontalis]